MRAVTGDLYQTIERTVGGLGYQLVDVERLGGGLLRVTLDGPEGIKVEDCERVSRQLSHLFAVEDVEFERLEVSSPGLDRPLKRAGDYVRFMGSEISVQLYQPLAAVGGRKRLRGRLLMLTGDAGAERVQMQLLPDEGAANGAPARPKMAFPQPLQDAPVVEFALVDVDKARLVPELNFRPGRTGMHEGRSKGDGGAIT